MAFEESELILTDKGEIYHLGIRPEDIAHKIIVVGDQDRVELITDLFDEVKHKSRHREFVCHTGTYKGKEISVISTGIGTDNIDIVINELDALVNIDFETRTLKDEKISLEIVRIGTSGILHDDIPVDSFLLSEYSYGLDNVAHFYQREIDKETSFLQSKIEEQVKVPKNVIPYLVKASETLNNRFKTDDVQFGITVTSSGFYAPQGRTIRLPLAEPNMIDSFSDFSYKHHRFINLEMETSTLFALSSALGHHATGICLGLANRRKKKFTSNYNTKIVELIKYVLDRF